MSLTICARRADPQRALLYRVSQEVGAPDAHRAMVDQVRWRRRMPLLSRFKAIQRISEIDRRERRAGFGAVQLQALVNEIGELYGPLAEDHDLELATETAAACEIMADRELLFEAFSNLVGNAVKFTPAGGSIRLKLTRLPEGPRIEVTDSGPGVPENEREAVLERFYRGRREPEAPIWPRPQYRRGGGQAARFSVGPG